MAASLIKIACVVLVCMALVGAPVVQGGQTCEEVIRALEPCAYYVLVSELIEVEPSEKCCEAAESVVNHAQTTADKKAVCNCLKSEADSYIGALMVTNAARIPGKCGFTIPYDEISTSTDCDKIADNSKISTVHAKGSKHAHHGGQRANIKHRCVDVEATFSQEIMMASVALTS